MHTLGFLCPSFKTSPAAVIVLAMHGAPPNDFSPCELSEYFNLHMQLEQMRGPQHATLEARYAELDAKIRAWPRTAENDPFYAGSLALAQQLRQAAGHEVIMGFNEFCAPSLDEALDQAAVQLPDKVIAITPMMTRGGAHSEHDIPVAIQRAQARHPSINFIYVWPFDLSAAANFLAAQIDRVS
jgi:sirohydrochlorin cobaltochelatase